MYSAMTVYCRLEFIHLGMNGNIEIPDSPVEELKETGHREYLYITVPLFSETKHRDSKSK